MPDLPGVVALRMVVPHSGGSHFCLGSYNFLPGGGHLSEIASRQFFPFPPLCIHKKMLVTPLCLQGKFLVPPPLAL